MTIHPFLSLPSVFSVMLLAACIAGADDTPQGKASPSKSFKLKSAAEFGWFEEAPVKFVGPDAPPEVQAVKGTVYDSRGEKVAEVTVKREDFLREGWVWKAPAPGLYDIAFESVEEKGGVQPITRSWIQRGAGKMVTLTKDHYTAAVVKKGTWKERPAQFGIDQQDDSQEMAIRMGARLGFGFGRKWIMAGDDWSRKSSINSAPGVYQWDSMDRYFALCKQYGYRNNLATFWGTPRWASPHPELADEDVCVMRYSEYPPTDLKYFSDFVAAAVERYGADIKNWEIWNEPHLPLNTCFWKGTPADYTALLKTAYETIKRVQPKSTVWLGGMAPRRYLPFYQEFLKTGGYPYFDMYSAHGSYPEMEITRKAEAAAGLKPRPWSSSEWHAILVSANDPVQSEAALGRRMMTDLFQQLKNGVDRVVLFDLINGNNEIEALPFSQSIGEMGQAVGLFRRRPDFEPRLSAVIMHDFLTRVVGRVEFVREYDLGLQKAVLLNNGGKPLLVVWNEGTNPMPLDPQLAKAVSSAGSATTWEGKPWTNGLLDTTSLVYFTEVDRAILDALKAPATALLYPWQRKKAQAAGYANVCKGPLSSVPLFGKVEEEVNPRAAWIGDNLVFRGINGQSQPPGFSARFAVFAGKTGLDLAVDVRDAVFVQNSKPGEYHEGDSVQFAVDSEGNGQEAETTELSVALMPDGPVVWKNRASFIGGDLPGHWSPDKQPVKYARAVVKKTKSGLLYKVHVDWSEFYPYSFDPKKTMRFSLLVNDNDGNGRLGWLEWSSGIGAEKNSTQFGKLQLGGVSQAAAPNLFGKDALAKGSGSWKPWWSESTTNATVQYLCDLADSPSAIKLSLPDEGSTGGLRSAQIPVSAGATYHLSARVRGKGKLRCHWVHYDGQKQKLTTDMSTVMRDNDLDLTGEWQMVDQSLLIPKDVEACSFNFLIYKESGSLEIADVRLEKE